MSATDASPGGTTINFPGPPAFEQRVTTPGREVTTEGAKTEYGVLSPEQRANLDQSDTLASQQADTVERQRQQQAQADQIEAEHQQQALDAQNALAEEKAKRDEALQKDVSTWQNRLEGAYQAAKSQPSPALFADSTTGEKAKRSIGLALAGLGDMIAAGAAARYGTPRTNNFGDIVEADLQRQREKIAKLKDNVLMAKTGVQDATEARKVALAEIDAKGAGFLARLGTYAQARLAGLKAGDQGQIAAQNTLAEIQQKKLEYQQRSLAPLTEKHQAASTNVKTQGPTIENTTRDAKPADAKSAKDIAMGDPLNPAEAGKPLGEVTSGRGGAQAFSQTDTGLTTAVDALHALAKDIKENGERPTSMADIKRRDALRNNATLQVGAVSTAGQSDLALSTEAGTIGATHNPVTQWLKGDNPEAIARKIHELENRKVRNRGQGLLPMSPEATASLNARQAPVTAVATNMIPPMVPKASEAPKNAVPPVTQTAPETPRAAAVRLLKANRNRPGAAAIRKSYNITDEDLR